MPMPNVYAKLIDVQPSRINIGWMRFGTLSVVDLGLAIHIDQIALDSILLPMVIHIYSYNPNGLSPVCSFPPTGSFILLPSASSCLAGPPS